MADACVHLHTHDSRSFKDGLSPTRALVDRAAELGQPGLGLTNHGHLFSAPVFFQACQDAGIKGVIGMEAYEAVPHTWDPDPEGPHHALFKGKWDRAIDRYFHLTLWVLNQRGWENLCALHTHSFTKAYKPKNQPLIDRASLERHNGGLLVGLGCPQSRTNRALQREGYQAAVKAAQWYCEVFEDRVRIEVMAALPDQVRMLDDQRRLAKHFRRPAVAVNDVHYVHRSDGVLGGPHHMLVMARKFKSQETAATESGDQSDDSFGSWYGSDQFYLKSRQEMIQAGLFAQEVDASIDILELVQFEFLKMADPKPPAFRTPVPGEEPEFDSWLASRT